MNRTVKLLCLIALCGAALVVIFFMRSLPVGVDMIPFLIVLLAIGAIVKSVARR